MSDVVFVDEGGAPPGWKPPPPPRREKPAAMPPIDEAKSVAGPAGEYEALLRKVLADGLVHFQELGVVEDFEKRRGLGAADRERALSLFGWTPDEFRRSPAYGELLSLVLADGTVEAAERDLGLGWTDDDFAERREPARGDAEAAGVADAAAAAAELRERRRRRVRRRRARGRDGPVGRARRLGGGGFGDVFRGALRGGDVAIKRVHAQSLQGLRSSRRRSGAGQAPGPVARAAAGPRPPRRGRLCLVYELCDGGTLEDRLADKRNPPTGRRVAAVRDAIRGLYYLHTQGDGEKCFIHGDVKTANILLTSAGGAKLADFGLVRELAKGATHVGTTSLTGSWGYICPAFARTGRVAPSTDVFAFGVVLLEVLTGLPPSTATGRRGPRVARGARRGRDDGAPRRRGRRGAHGADGRGPRLAMPRGRPEQRPSSEDVHDAIEELELEQSRQSFASRRPLSGATGRMLFGDEPATPRPRAVGVADDARRRRVRVLVGSFNMNGEGLDVSTLGSWLRHGTEAAKGRAFTALVGHLEAHLESHSAVPEASIGHTRMGMRLLVYARRDVGLAVSEVCKDAFTAGGIFKGALTASMLLSGDGFEERFVFTTAHLPAHEGRAEKRNAALARIRKRRRDDAVARVASVQRCVDAGDYSMLQRVDELRRELDDGGRLATFASPPCRFPPTFKVAKKRGFFYLNSRLPSYTDRILYAAPDAGGDRADEYDGRRRLHVRPQAAPGCFEVALGGGDAADAAGATGGGRPSTTRHSVLDPTVPA
ncbi:serine/threonine kinase [Aureococcus anophagefferens]|nr:serine/threonine kinase [Aureococcus anophagefferens]